ncbi:MAG: hypothetical protein ABSC24_10190, partial [Verrucomicrobiota bacterium]
AAEGCSQSKTLPRHPLNRIPKLPVVADWLSLPRSAPVLGRSDRLLLSHRIVSNCSLIPRGCGRDGSTPPSQKFNFGFRANPSQLDGYSIF